MTEHKKAKTPAQKKRRPFAIKNGDSSHYIYCSDHPAEVATFYCATCHDPFGEACVGKEIGDQTICSNCVDNSIQNEVDQLDRKKRNRRIRNVSIAGLTAIVLAINIFIIVRYSPNTDQVTQPKMSSQLSKLVECRHNLEALAYQAKYYKNVMGRLPESIHELKDLLDNPKQAFDSVTSKAYLIKTSDNGTPIVTCPNPEAHGLAELYALPGKPAKMIYKKALSGTIQ